MGINPQIESLNQVGQSVWYDNLSRDVLKSGELQKIIDAGVSGLTSNPTIFKKAIADSDDYDGDVRTLMAKGLNAETIVEELMIDDVGRAADLLRPIYDRTNAADGYASIEVSPFLARDTKNTVAMARKFWDKLKRPNIMIKIPGTPEGLPAIEETLAEGINVNVTLIFSTEVYTKVAESYIAGLEKRAKKGQPIDRIASVASFFVSRVDAICEERFDSLVKAGKAQAVDKETFFGKVGIANSRLAYKRYGEIFGGAKFAGLKGKNAQKQRPLWASTGTKNPKFSPVLYVEELAGDNTVNTVPPATLKAILSTSFKASARVESGFPEAAAVISGLEKLHVPVSELLIELQDRGVDLFADSYRELIAAVEGKMKKLRG